MEEETRYCDYCGAELGEDEGTWIGDSDLLCDDCVDDHCVTCDHCGEIVWNQDSEDDDHTFLCRSCYTDYYSRCECCGVIMHNDCTSWRHDPMSLT